MKKCLSLLLAVLMLSSVCLGLVSCGGGNDAGAIINAYYVGEMYDFDPAYAMIDDDAARVLSLLYEPLFRLDNRGRVQNALAEEYKIIKRPEKDLYQMEIKLRDASWSDGSQVTAYDVVYSWQRLIDPGFKSQAAALLYEIEGAVEVKTATPNENGEYMVSPEGDFKVTAEDAYTITITFRNHYDENGNLVEVDYEAFRRKLTSIALAPVSQTTVSKAEDYWATRAATIVTCGPFRVSTLDLALGEFALERNRYYHRLKMEDETLVTMKELKSNVNPYQIVSNWADYVWSEDADTNMWNSIADSFAAETVFLLCDMPLEMRIAQKKKAETADLLSTSTVLLNQTETGAAFLKNADVRKALSLAIDRTAIASLLTFAKPADGFISHRVFETDSRRETFRNENSALLSTTAKLTEAEALLADANLRGVLTLRLAHADNEADAAVANYLKETWEGLEWGSGVTFRVELTALSYHTERVYPDKNDQTQYYMINSSELEDVYEDFELRKYNADGVLLPNKAVFDAVIVDYQMLSPDAFAPLCGFSSWMNGNGVDFVPDAEGVRTETAYKHMTGYDSESFDAKIEEAYDEADLTKRAAILHDAEEILLEDMPIIPLTFGQGFYVKSGLIRGIDTNNYYGYPILTEMSMKNYEKYLPEDPSES